MTDVFIWEDMPIKNPKTGKYTMAGWIMLTLKLIKYNFVIFMAIVHITQCLPTVINDREFLVECWFPFDVHSSPAFELINVLEVSKYID